MLRQACKLQVQIREALPPNTPLPYISVNLTPETLALPDLPARFKAILQAHGVQARHIKPEILELPFPDAHAATIKQNIRLLHEAGHMNVLDDFLTGSSDFARLRELRPYLAGVKINHCFQELSPKEQAETLRELRSMGMEITMERVADPHDYDVAIQAGSNLAQGHRYFKPMDARAAAIMYASSAQASVNSQQTFDDEPDEWQPDAHGVAEPVTL